MAGKTCPMSQIKQLLQLHRQGQSIKQIARTLCISKNTVKSYLYKLALCPEPLDVLIMMDDPLLESIFHRGDPAYKDSRYEDFQGRIKGYTEELKRTGVTRLTLWQEYRRDQPQGYGYTQFCFHFSQYLQASKPSMILDHPPGESMYIDFAGEKQSYIDRATGTLIECPVFVACMAHSDYGFAMAVRDQTLDEFLFALGCALEHFGGVPKMIVPDNLKTAIVKSDRYEPDIQRAMEDFANHYGTAVVPARVRRPRDKALVENHVRLVYSRVYAKLRHQSFFDLLTLNRAISEKMREHNQTRMQQKPYCRQECFLSQEKPLLGALPSESYQIKSYRMLKVAKNGHIYLSQDKHQYSVPYQHTGQKAQVIYTRSMVRIYVCQKLVATHPRGFTPGGHSTLMEHLCPAHQHHLKRSPDQYLQKAEQISELLHRLFQRIFEQSKPLVQLYRSCDGLLHLARKADIRELERACQTALELEQYTYRFVCNVLHNRMEDASRGTPQQALPSHRNIRGKQYFTQQSHKTESS